MVKKSGNGDVWHFTVEYIADGKTYKVQDIPVGMKSRAELDGLEVGDSMFGKDLMIIPKDPNHFVVTVDVYVSL